jgi:hypothetical protein
MNNELTTAEKELLRSLKTGRTKEEIFNGIASRIKDSHEEEISEEESRRLARNFIGFCQKVIDIQIRIERERERERVKKKAIEALTYR